MICILHKNGCGIKPGTVQFVPIIYLELLSIFDGSWAISLYIVLAGAISVFAVRALTADKG